VSRASCLLLIIAMALSAAFADEDPPPTALPPSPPSPTFEQSFTTIPAPADCVLPERNLRFPLDASWHNGLRFENRDAGFNLHVGGNGQWDSVWLIGPKGVLADPENLDSTQNDSASLLRRARVRFDGTIYERFNYMLEYELANAVNENRGLQDPSIENVSVSPQPVNVWLQVRDVPWFGRVRVGQQLKPLRMSAASEM